MAAPKRDRAGDDAIDTADPVKRPKQAPVEEEPAYSLLPNELREIVANKVLPSQSPADELAWALTLGGQRVGGPGTERDSHGYWKRLVEREFRDPFERQPYPWVAHMTRLYDRVVGVAPTERTYLASDYVGASPAEADYTSRRPTYWMRAYAHCNIFLKLMAIFVAEHIRGIGFDVPGSTRLFHAIDGRPPEQDDGAYDRATRRGDLPLHLFTTPCRPEDPGSRASYYWPLGEEFQNHIAVRHLDDEEGIATPEDDAETDRFFVRYFSPDDARVARVQAAMKGPMPAGSAARENATIGYRLRDDEPLVMSLEPCNLVVSHERRIRERLIPSVRLVGHFDEAQQCYVFRNDAGQPVATADACLQHIVAQGTSTHVALTFALRNLHLTRLLDVILSRSADLCGGLPAHMVVPLWFGLSTHRKLSAHVLRTPSRNVRALLNRLAVEDVAVQADDGTVEGETTPVYMITGPLAIGDDLLRELARARMSGFALLMQFLLDTSPGGTAFDALVTLRVRRGDRVQFEPMPLADVAYSPRLFRIADVVAGSLVAGKDVLHWRGVGRTVRFRGILHATCGHVNLARPMESAHSVRLAGGAQAPVLLCQRCASGPDPDPDPAYQ